MSLSALPSSTVIPGGPGGPRGPVRPGFPSGPLCPAGPSTPGGPGRPASGWRQTITCACKVVHPEPQAKYYMTMCSQHDRDTPCCLQCLGYVCSVLVTCITAASHALTLWSSVPSWSIGSCSSLRSWCTRRTYTRASIFCQYIIMDYGRVALYS